MHFFRLNDRNNAYYGNKNEKFFFDTIGKNKLMIR